MKNVKTLTGLHGRWDVIHENPTIILDVAHNEDGVKQLLKQLSVINNRPSLIHFVIGMVKDKDVTKVLSILPKDGRYYFSNAHIARAMPHEQLKEKATAFGLNGESFDEVNSALHAAKRSAAAGDIIIVCGSVFIVAEVDSRVYLSESSLLNA